MIFNFSWLPKLIIFDNKESFEKYYDKIYDIFKRDFVETRPFFQSKPVGLQIEPKVNGKIQTFHHITTEDIKDKKGNIIRKIAIDRCERIAWNKAIIESNYFGLKIFPEKRSHNRKNIVIWFEEKDFVIILREAKNYYVFITAYPIKYKHKKEKLQKSYTKHLKAETAQNKADSTLFLH